ncbi:hypothetical protein [Negadavirga shengliensis]|uniref:Uncharacterized protein n=1 Tax=Negadavirga shengliensis TaxID=1389218 RepID=A0ABV9SVP0_9BACT
MRKMYTNPFRWSKAFYFISGLFLALTGCIQEETAEMQEPLPDFDVEHWASGLKPFELTDPVFTDPDYDSLFIPDFSITLMEKIWDAEKLEITPMSSAAWQMIKEKAGQAGPGVAELLVNIDWHLLREILDRDTALDPLFEAFLVGLLETEELGLHLPELPEIALDNLTLDREMSRKAQMEASLRKMTAMEFDDSCEGMVYFYADGMRKGNSEFREQGLEAIFTDFLNAYDKADGRFQQRNLLINELYGERLALVSVLIEKGLALAHKAANIDTCEIRDQLNHLSVLYAYYIRKQFDAWYLTALNLNRYFYEKELGQIDELRAEREAELEQIFQERGDAISEWEENALKACEDTGTFALPEIF